MRIPGRSRRPAISRCRTGQARGNCSHRLRARDEPGPGIRPIGWPGRVPAVNRSTAGDVAHDPRSCRRARRGGVFADIEAARAGPQGQQQAGLHGSDRLLHPRVSSARTWSCPDAEPLRLVVSPVVDSRGKSVRTLARRSGRHGNDPSAEEAATTAYAVAHYEELPVISKTTSRARTKKKKRIADSQAVSLRRGRRRTQSPSLPPPHWDHCRASLGSSGPEVPTSLQATGVPSGGPALPTGPVVRG